MESIILIQLVLITTINTLWIWLNIYNKYFLYSECDEQLIGFIMTCVIFCVCCRHDFNQKDCSDHLDNGKLLISVFLVLCEGSFFRIFEKNGEKCKKNFNRDREHHLLFASCAIDLSIFHRYNIVIDFLCSQ